MYTALGIHSEESICENLHLLKHKRKYSNPNDGYFHDTSLSNRNCYSYELRVVPQYHHWRMASAVLFDTKVSPELGWAICTWTKLQLGWFMPQSKTSQTATHTLKLKRKNTPVVGPFYIYETKYKYIYVYIYICFKYINIYTHNRLINHQLYKWKIGPPWNITN